MSTTTGGGGTVRWMAVELLAPKPATSEDGKHTKQTDVWAYGMVIYVSANMNVKEIRASLRLCNDLQELLTSNIPFFELHFDVQVALAIVGGQRPSRPAILKPEPSREQLRLLWTVCLQCWEESPLARPEMAQICAVLSNLYAPPNYLVWFVSSC